MLPFVIKYRNHVAKDSTTVLNRTWLFIVNSKAYYVQFRSYIVSILSSKKKNISIMADINNTLTLSIVITFYSHSKNVTFMDMAPRSLKTLFTSFEKPVKSSPVRFYCLLHDMSFLIPLHAIEKIRSY